MPVPHRPEYFAVLDGLRALAALAIVLFHFYNQWAGYLAVEFFFVLSGFVFSHGYLKIRGTQHSWAYVGRRLARLYPMHLWSLTIFGLVFWVLYGSLPYHENGLVSSLFAHLTLTHAVGLNPFGDWNAVSWVVSVEFWLGVFAFVFVVTRFRSFILALISLTGFLVIAMYQPNLGVTYENLFGYFSGGFLRGASSFLLGVLSYRLYFHYRARPWSPSTSSRVELLLVAAVVLVVLASSEVVTYFGFEVVRYLDFLAPPLFMVFVTVFALEGGYISTLLAPLSGLGRLSYSVYLNHYAVLIAVEAIAERYPMATILTLSVYLSIVLSYSWWTHRFIERPLRLSLTKLIDSGHKPKAPRLDG